MSKLTVPSIRLASGERIALLAHGPLGERSGTWPRLFRGLNIDLMRN